MTIVRVLAPNPSIYTGPGTNTYVISDGSEAVVLDPGPVIADHESAIHAALGAMTPVAVIATHTHPDHAPMANPLASRLGVPVFGFGPGPEFLPDVVLTDGAEVSVGSTVLTAVHTPG
ncbi:MAG: MBL fold metallo-hydrolase, partial [Acidimicrobiia bacterium]|nr:MBL fold metallo-hydrolase [Acidimicrobiia bacterium]